MQRKGRRDVQCECAERAIRTAMLNMGQWAGPSSLAVDQVATWLGVREEDVRSFVVVGLLELQEGDDSKVTARSLLAFLDNHGAKFAEARLKWQAANLAHLVDR